MGQKNYYHNNQYGGRPQFEAPQVNNETTSAAKRAVHESLNYAKQNPGKSALIAVGGVAVVSGLVYGLPKAYKYAIRCFKKKKSAPTAPAETPEKPAEAPAESAAEEGKK